MARRRQYTVPQKLAILQDFARLQDEGGHSLRAAARSLEVDASQLRRWRREAESFNQFIAPPGNQNRRVNRAARSLHPGRKSCLSNIEEELLLFIFEHREQGISVSIQMVVTKASQLDNAFRHKTSRAKDQAVRRFVNSHGLVHRVHTHESQRNANEVAVEAQDWMNMIRPMLIGLHRSEAFMFNMDQTPIFFSMVPRTTLHSVGACTVNVRTSTSSTMRVTVAVTITASGTVLPPMLIFKGKRGGRIVREFSQYAVGGLYEVQEKAWMDEAVMMSWVDRVLKPYLHTAPFGIHPILILDSYRCHLMPSIINAIADLGVQVEHIPGGCTGMCQPVDVGIGKPLKNRVRACWENWMLSQGHQTIQFSPPSRQIVAGWVVTSLQNLEERIIKNSWRHKPFSYFETEDHQYNGGQQNLQAGGQENVNVEIDNARQEGVEYANI